MSANGAAYTSPGRSPGSGDLLAVLHTQGSALGWYSVAPSALRFAEAVN
ncbi:MAG TPA: hypothetical protein VGN16_16245 [Acidobacteriaceae bacterium]